jgi:flagellar biosynthesis protein FlhA
MISNQHRAADGAIHVITLSQHVEKILSDAMDHHNHGFNLNLSPRVAQQLIEAAANRMEDLATLGYMPIVLCSATVRLAFKRLTERALPNLTILAYSEIARGVDVHAQGMVELVDDEA